MDDRLRERRQHLGRHGCRARREEVALLRHRVLSLASCHLTLDGYADYALR